MQITIEKNVPLASHGHQRYPFHKMEIGDSFSVPFTEKSRNLISSAVCAHVKRHGGKFTVRTVKDEGVVRVWRVA